MFALAGQGAAQEDQPLPPLPSGLAITLQEVFLDEKPDGVHIYARFRFVAPGLAAEDAPDVDARFSDMQALCDLYALPRVRATDAPIDRITISIADRETMFGKPAPEAIQYFEAFAVGEDACIWEEF